MAVDTVHNGLPREDLYRCSMCRVVFHEPHPEWYDIAECPRCGWPSSNCCLDLIEVEDRPPLDELEAERADIDQ